jgi:hypothetical protein
VLARRSKSVATAGISALAGMVLMLGLSAGTAEADKLRPNPAKPSAGPVAEKGVRKQAISGELRAADIGSALAQGAEVRESDIATPKVKGGSPPPGNLSKLNYRCKFSWSEFC